jgi:hypothetical protein
MSAQLLALNALNDRLMAAEAIGDALDAAGGDQPPAWVHVYRNQIRLIQEASEALETLVCRGIGGVPPDIAKRNGIEVPAC